MYIRKYQYKCGVYENGKCPHWAGNEHVSGGSQCWFLTKDVSGRNHECLVKIEIVKDNLIHVPLVPQCPECGEELTHLNKDQQFFVTQTFDGKEYGPRTIDEPCNGDVDYRCPKCCTSLATDECEAKEILKVF